MNPKLPIALLGTALFLMAPVASANPPPGTTDNCLGGGYNPAALTNVCVDDGPSTPDNTGQVTTTQGPCIIGQTCVPIPGYDPSGGTPIPSVTVSTVSYADVNTPVMFCSVPFAYSDNPPTVTPFACKGFGSFVALDCIYARPTGPYLVNQC